MKSEILESSKPHSASGSVVVGQLFNGTLIKDKIKLKVKVKVNLLPSNSLNVTLLTNCRNGWTLVVDVFHAHFSDHVRVDSLKKLFCCCCLGFRLLTKLKGFAFSLGLTKTRTYLDSLLEFAERKSPVVDEQLAADLLADRRRAV